MAENLAGSPCLLPQSNLDTGNSPYLPSSRAYGLLPVEEQEHENFFCSRDEEMSVVAGRRSRPMLQGPNWPLEGPRREVRLKFDLGSQSPPVPIPGSPCPWGPYSYPTRRSTVAPEKTFVPVSGHANPPLRPPCTFHSEHMAPIGDVLVAFLYPTFSGMFAALVRLSFPSPKPALDFDVNWTCFLRPVWRCFQAFCEHSLCCPSPR